MDATRLFFSATMVVFALFIMACGNNTPSKVVDQALNGQNCAAQVKSQSFLVKWKGAVPAEYSGQIIHPGSLITKFSNIEQTTLENTVLATHVDQLEWAEHEFYVRNVIPPVRIEATTTTTATAWGPSDAQAQLAWVAAGNKAGDGVIVAVVDSGADITHTLLQAAVYVNPREIPNNQIDDDKNGYIDDVSGFNFISNNGDVTDEVGHGTHVSGIIAGQAGPNSFTGIAPNAKIMPLKFIDASGGGDVSSAIAAVAYATNNGAKVINASWGGSECSSLLQQEIQAVTNKGVLFASAAGNSGGDINTPQYVEWPAAFQIPGKITVGAMSSAQVLSTFSNYGSLVDLAAPGENILSTLPPSSGQTDNQLGVLSGTSMATPFVAGTAALLYALKPSATPVCIANAINSSVVLGRYGVRTKGKLNALAAVQYMLSH